MKGLRIVAAIVLVVFAVSSAAVAGPYKAKPGKPLRVKIHTQGQVFCPASALVFGNIVITSGRCYVVYVLRDVRGTFLAFAPPGAFIPPGQLVRLSTPAGAKLRGRIFYLVPIQTTAVIVPMNTISLVAFRAEDFGPQMVLILTSAPSPNVSVTFVVRL